MLNYLNFINLLAKMDLIKRKVRNGVVFQLPGHQSVSSLHHPYIRNPHISPNPESEYIFEDFFFVSCVETSFFHFKKGLFFPQMCRIMIADSAFFTRLKLSIHLVMYARNRTQLTHFPFLKIFCDFIRNTAYNLLGETRYL
jgi:hypothetical protein